MLTDKEIFDDIDYYENLLEKEGNNQCYYCGGWALTCPCKENMYSEETKKAIIRLIELKEKYAKQRRKKKVLEKIS